MKNNTTILIMWLISIGGIIAMSVLYHPIWFITVVVAFIGLPHPKYTIEDESNGLDK